MEAERLQPSVPSMYLRRCETKIERLAFRPYRNAAL